MIKWSTVILCLLSVYHNINAAEEKSLFARLRLRGFSTGSATPSPDPRQPPKKKSSKNKKDDDFTLCSAKLPESVILLIARYYLGSEDDGLRHSLMANALRSSSVIAYCPADISKFDISLYDKDPRLMMLTDFSHDMSNPMINTFNVATGERILIDQKLSTDAVENKSKTRKISAARNGMFVPWTYYTDEDTQELVIIKNVHAMMPKHTVFDSEERRFSLGLRILDETVKVAIVNRWHSSMDLALLQHIGENLWIRWIFNASDEPVQLQPDTKKEPLNVHQENVQLIASDDRARIGIVFPQEVVLFDGATGIELTRYRLPKGFSFQKSCFPKNNVTAELCYNVQIRAIAQRNERDSCYELLAFVNTTGLAHSEDRYIRWDIGTEAVIQNTRIRKGYLGTLVGRHILESKGCIAMHTDLNNQLVACNPVEGDGGVFSLWQAGMLNEFYAASCSMYVNRHGSHIVLYGRSPDSIASDKSLYELRATTLHFDPTILYKTGDAKVTDSSLLQRIRLMRALCLATGRGDVMTLTDKGKALFAQLHPQVRHNFQTTMPNIQGWQEEPTARASRIPILPPLKLPEQKLSDDKKQIAHNQKCTIA